MESVVSKVMNRREGDNKRALIKKVTGAIVQEESLLYFCVFVYGCSIFTFFWEDGREQGYFVDLAALHFHDLAVLLLSHDIEASNLKICKDSLEIL